MKPKKAGSLPDLGAVAMSVQPSRTTVLPTPQTDGPERSLPSTVETSISGSMRLPRAGPNTIASWPSGWRLADGRSVADSASGADLSVNELLLAYLASADAYYVKNGKPTTEPVNIR